MLHQSARAGGVLPRERRWRLAATFGLCLALSPCAQADLFKCVVDGATRYQDSPCRDKGAARAIDRSGLSVVDGSDLRSDASVFDRPRLRPAIGVISRPATEGKSCERLRKRLRTIDAKARERSTGKLAQQRRETRAAMAEDHCSEL